MTGEDIFLERLFDNYIRRDKHVQYVNETVVRGVADYFEDWAEEVCLDAALLNEEISYLADIGVL